MDKKKILTALFDEYETQNLQRLKQFWQIQKEPTKSLTYIIPYLISGNFEFVPGFDQSIPPIHIAHFKLSEKGRSLVSNYFDLRNIPPIGVKINAEIIAIYLYWDPLTTITRFIIFYHRSYISPEQIRYLKLKAKAIEAWCLRRLKIKISIDLTSGEPVKLIHFIDQNNTITIFDFYQKGIHLEGKHHYAFLFGISKNELQYNENRSLMNKHHWLNVDHFFDLSFYHLPSQNITDMVTSLLNHSLVLTFETFHKILYYHALNKVPNLSDLYLSDIKETYPRELAIIKQWSGFPFHEVMFLTYIFLQKSRHSEEYQHYFKQKMLFYEELSFLSQEQFTLKEMIQANDQLKYFLNLFVSLYADKEKGLLSLLDHRHNGIAFQNFLGIVISPDQTMIKFLKGKWGLYEIIPAQNQFKNIQEIFSTPSLIKTIIIAIYNGYIDKAIPQIKAKNQNILDENNNFNRLKNKLLKYHIKFSQNQFLEHIDHHPPKILNIYIFLNFSTTNLQNYFKDYTYISENWDPLNYGYKKVSNINEMILVVKDETEQLQYYEYYSDEALIIAIKNLFMNEYTFNEDVHIAVNMFDTQLSASLIFRLKKLILNAYKAFSEYNAILLTAYNGKIYLLKKSHKEINIALYNTRDDFLEMLKNEDEISSYIIDEDVIELNHFAKITASIQTGIVQYYYYPRKKGNYLYIFDELNHFYYLKHFDMSLFMDMISLGVNHIRNWGNDEIIELEVYQIEEKELNQFDIIQMDINRFKDPGFNQTPLSCSVEGVKRDHDIFFNYTIQGETFSQEKFGKKTFWAVLKYVGINSIDKIQFTHLKTTYIRNGVKYKNLKYKLIIYDELNALVAQVKEKWFGTP